MAKQVVDNGDTGLVSRTKINENFTEVYETHTGEVTGATALTVNPTAISNKTLKAIPAGTEEVLINDAGTLKKTTAQAIADLGGGGTEYQIYDARFFIDSPVATQWVGQLDRIALEFNQTTSVDLTASMLTATDATIESSQYIGVAVGNQTIEQLVLNFQVSNDGFLTHLSVIKATMNNGSITSKAILIEQTITVVGGVLVLDAVDFTETTISDGDVIYIYFGTGLLSDISPCFYRLKCSIN